MTALPQFLGMREAHDERRRRRSDGVAALALATWQDCDTCVAIAAFDEVMRALESLTPGGSEFHQEPDRCVKHVRDRFESMRQILLRKIPDPRDVAALLADRCRDPEWPHASEVTFPVDGGRVVVYLDPRGDSL